MQLFAHRGVSALAPENSSRAFEMALTAQADGIELDVRGVADKAMVIHDEDLQRTTNGSGSVYNLSFSQWQQLDAGDGKPPPVLLDVLAMVAGKSQVNIELKCCSAIKPVMKDIKQAMALYGFEPEQLCLSAFDHHILKAVRCELPSHPVAPLISACPLDYAACAEPLIAQAIHCHVETTNLELVEDAHARGLDVRVYTVTRELDLLRMRTLGVDAVFVDDIHWAQAVLAH